ncbi:MAG: phosphatase PAP2 family protein [Pirellulaceae bacterium]
MNLIPARLPWLAGTRGDAASRQSRQNYVLAAALAVAAFASLAIDIAAAQFVQRNHTGGVFREVANLLTQAEPFAHAAGVAVIMLVIYVLDPQRRAYLLRVGVCAFGAGLAADVVKVAVIRSRPRHMPDAASVGDTFHGWFLLLRDFSMVTERALQSFPSGHAATAAGFAVALSWLYPRGRWLFFTLAMLAAFQRVATSAHFVSDICAGAAIGCFLAALITDSRLLGRWFDRYEARRSNAAASA